MRAFSYLSLVPTFLLSLSLSGHVAADSHEAGGRSAVSRRSRHVALQRKDLEKRDFQNARFTYYVDGQGACGGFNQPGDFIVALNAPQFAGGSHCYEEITISVGGKSTKAQIVDECMGCPYGGLDLSQGLFSFFADVSAGELSGSWNFGSGDPPAPSTTSTPPPPPPSTSHTPTPTPTPTPTYTPPPPPPSTTHHSSTSSSAPSSSAAPSSSTSSSTTSSTPTPTPTDTGILSQFNLAIVQLAGLVAVANSTQ